MKYLNIGLISSLVITTASASGSSVINYNDYATVISSQPNYVTTPPREECFEKHEHNVTPSQNNSERSLAGPIIGGMVGGLLGNTVGKGSGKTAATAVGAMAGAIVGDRIANNSPSSSTPTKVVRCRTIPGETQISGYTLTVQYNGRTMTIVNSMDVPVGYLVPVSVNVSSTGGSAIPPQYTNVQQPIQNNTNLPRQTKVR